MAKFEIEFAEPHYMNGTDEHILIDAKYSRDEAFAKMREDSPFRTKKLSAADLIEDYVRFGVWNGPDIKGVCWNFGRYTAKTRGAKKVWRLDI